MSLVLPLDLSSSAVRLSFFNSDTWVKVLRWDFKNGHYPGYWSWGNWELVDEGLQGRAVGSDSAVYFFPFDHGKDFVLETRMKFVESYDTEVDGLVKRVEGQLLTRDSSAILHESGTVLFCFIDQMYIRHTVNKEDYIRKRINLDRQIECGVWYKVEFMIYRGQIKVFLDDVEVYSSSSNLPVGDYHEPHLALFNGVARFEYVEIREVEKKDLLSSWTGYVLGVVLLVVVIWVIKIKKLNLKKIVR